MEEWIKKAKKVIEENSFMVLATTDQQYPWVTPVFYAHDENYNFYWHSAPVTKHSKFIEQNPNVSIVIFNSTNPELPGLYMEGKAMELDNHELYSGLEILMQKAVKNEKERSEILSHPEDFKAEGKLRMYKFVPAKFYINDSEKWNNKWVDWHVEVPLLKK